MNKKVYVGQTSKTLEIRWNEHLRLSRNGKELPLYRAIRKYGEDNFTVFVLEEIAESLLDERETYWIKQLHSFGKGGYNCTFGGDGLRGFHHTEETKLKIGNLSRNRSEESNKKISENLKGRKATEQQKSKMQKNLIENAIPAAVAWHKSKAGRDWHKKQGEKLKGKCFLPEITKICENCGKEYVSRKSNSRFCCENCKQRYYTKEGRYNVRKKCEWCGKEFKAFSKTTRFCSRSCANFAWHKRKSESKTCEDTKN